MIWKTDLYPKKNALLKRTFYLCLSIELFILFSDIFLNHLKIIPSRALRKVFNITREDSLGNWFSSLQALLAGATCLLVYLSLAKSASRKVRGWAILSGIFTFIALDDATKFHERAGTAFKTFFPVLESFPSYTWQITIAPIFAALGIYMLIFLAREIPKGSGQMGILTAFSLMAIAVGLDFIEGMNLEFLETIKYARHMMKAVEEFLEMLGTTMFLLVFLERLLSTGISITLGKTSNSG